MIEPVGTAVRDVHDGVLRQTPRGWVLLGERDQDTGEVRFPPSAHGGDRWEETELSTEGSLFAWSTVRMPFGHFEAPYTVGYVKLPEGVLVFAPLESPADEVLTVGQRFRLDVAVLWTEEAADVSGSPNPPPVPVRAYRFALVPQMSAQERGVGRV